MLVLLYILVGNIIVISTLHFLSVRRLCLLCGRSLTGLFTRVLSLTVRTEHTEHPSPSPSPSHYTVLTCLRK